MLGPKALSSRKVVDGYGFISTTTGFDPPAPVCLLEHTADCPLLTGVLASLTIASQPDTSCGINVYTLKRCHERNQICLCCTGGMSCTCILMHAQALVLEKKQQLEYLGVGRAQQCEDARTRILQMSVKAPPVLPQHHFNSKKAKKLWNNATEQFVWWRELRQSVLINPSYTFQTICGRRTDTLSVLRVLFSNSHFIQSSKHM